MSFVIAFTSLSFPLRLSHSLGEVLPVVVTLFFVSGFVWYLLRYLSLSFYKSIAPPDMNSR